MEEEVLETGVEVPAPDAEPVAPTEAAPESESIADTDE